MSRGRAKTVAAKKVIMKRLFAAWLEMPSLRLGQLLVNASGDLGNMKLFSIEDDALCDASDAMAVGLKASRKEKP